MTLIFVSSSRRKIPNLPSWGLSASLSCYSWLILMEPYRIFGDKLGCSKSNHVRSLHCPTLSYWIKLALKSDEDVHKLPPSYGLDRLFRQPQIIGSRAVIRRNPPIHRRLQIFVGIENICSVISAPESIKMHDYGIAWSYSKYRASPLEQLKMEVSPQNVATISWLKEIIPNLRAFHFHQILLVI